MSDFFMSSDFLSMSSDFLSMSFQADIFTIGLSKQFSRFLNTFQIFVYIYFSRLLTRFFYAPHFLKLTLNFYALYNKV